MCLRIAKRWELLRIARLYNTMFTSEIYGEKYHVTRGQGRPQVKWKQWLPWLDMPLHC